MSDYSPVSSASHQARKRKAKTFDISAQAREQDNAQTPSKQKGNENPTLAIERPTLERQSRFSYQLPIFIVFGFFCYSAGFITDWATTNIPKMYESFDIAKARKALGLEGLLANSPSKKRRFINCAQKRYQWLPQCQWKKRHNDQLWFSLSQAPRGTFLPFRLHNNKTAPLRKMKKQRKRSREEERARKETSALATPSKTNDAKWQ